MKNLTLDIWDTILRRECAADESKYAVARYLLTYYSRNMNEDLSIHDIVKLRGQCEWELAQQSKKDGKDDEYIAREVFQEMLKRLMFDMSVEEIDSISDFLVELEINYEDQISRLDAGIVDEIRKYKPENIYLISDFYHSSCDMKKILEKYHAQVPYKGIYISCDYKLNKKSGRLFSLVENELEISPEEHLHIGDSKVADVDAPEGLGISANIYLPNEEHKGRLQREEMYRKRKEGQIEDYLKEVNSKLDAIGFWGQQYSLFFFCYVYEIIEEAIKRDMETIYYFTREGEFFKKIHEAIAKAGVFQGKMPRAELLEVSRMATFAPSVKNFDRNELMRLWIQYHDQSFEMFFKSLNVELTPYLPYLSQYGIEPTEVICNIYDDSRVKLLLEDETFKREMCCTLYNKRVLFKEYCRTKGIEDDERDIFIVDIGWRGSIQDNVALMYPQKKVYGYYIGLFEPFYPPVTNSIKEAFISNRNSEDYLWCLNYVDPVEMLCNSGNGSTMGYTKKGNQVCAVRQNISTEDEVFWKYTESFQKEIIACMEVWGMMAKKYSFMSNELKPSALRCFEQMITKPKQQLIDAYFKLEHNESFGKGSLDRKEHHVGIGKKVLSCFSKRNRENYFMEAEKCHWPQAFLMKFSPRWLDEYNAWAKSRFVEYISPFSLEAVSVDISGYVYENENMQCYIENFEKSDAYLSVTGWAVILGVDSKRCNILIRLHNDKEEFCFLTKNSVRRDVTNHFSDGTSYDRSGFCVKIPIENIPNEIYKCEILIIKDESTMCSYGTECTLLNV